MGVLLVARGRPVRLVLQHHGLQVGLSLDNPPCLLAYSRHGCPEDCSLEAWTCKHSHHLSAKLCR